MDCEVARLSMEQDNATESPEITAHLACCAECRAYEAELRHLNAALRAVLSAEPDRQRWTRLKQRVAARLDVSEARRRAWTNTWRVVAALVAVAALGVIAFDALRPSMSGTQASAKRLSARVAELQQRVRDKQLLEELEQLQIAFKENGDAEARSVAEDAELYVERILSLELDQVDQLREILAGIRAAGISQRLERVRASLRDDAPRPILTSLEMAEATLNEAGRIIK